MENISNTELLYDLLDSLTDEEFREFLSILPVDGEKVEQVIDKKTSATEPDPVAERREMLRERLEYNRRRKVIKEKLEAVRGKQIAEGKAAPDGAAKHDDEVRKMVMEKLNISRKKKAIQERIKAAREGK